MRHNSKLSCSTASSYFATLLISQKKACYLCQSFNGSEIFGPPVQHALIKFLFLHLITLLPLLFLPFAILVIILCIKATQIF